MKAISSYHQDRLWFIENFEKGVLYPGSPVYHNLPLILELKGKLDTRLLEECITIVWKQHDVLRTSILTENAAPVQYISNDAVFRLSEAAPAGKVGMECYMELVRQPFRFEEQLFRVHLVKYGDEEYALIFIAHHAIADRSTLQIIVRQVAGLYNAGCEGRPLEAVIPQTQYAAYAAWQRNLPEELVEELVLGWKQQLKNIHPLMLNTDRKRAPVHIYEGAVATKQLPATLRNQVEMFRDKYSCTVDLLLLAVFKVLMLKCTRQEHIIIGTISDNRDMPGMEYGTGPVNNLLPINSRLSNDSSLLDVVAIVRENREQADNYKALPFDRLVSDLKPRNDMSRTALFDVLFHYEYMQGSPIALHGIAVQELETNYGLGKYDLNLLIKEQENGFSLYLTYNSAYFEPASAQRILEHYTVLLENALARPEEQIKNVGFVSNEERTHLLNMLDRTKVPCERNSSIVDVFERTVREYPDHIALEDGQDQLTYKELNALSNRMAHFISSYYGETHGKLVAIRLERSQWQIIAMLGVLKCGAAYLPLDASYPEERITFLLEDSGCCACMDDKIIELFIERQLDYSDENRNLSISSDDLAYLIYTSGSTGQPKGVLIEHGNVVRLFKTGSFLFSFGSNDVWTLYHSFSFDFSVWEIFGALLFGGRLILVSKETARDIYRFKALLQQKKVTVLNQTPSAFYRLQELVKEGDAFDLRYIIFGGEKLQPSLLKAWRGLFPKVMLINMYGITETTVHTTFKALSDAEIANGISNIGTPLPTVSCYVLDENLQPLPATIPGELYVGGYGVARGYHNRPDLNSEKFIDNPFGAGKLYRSGDKARILSNGEIEYLGRIDDQVKIRGFRIEPGEIEHALLSHSSVAAVVVIARQDEKEGDELIAFVKGKEALTLSDLRSHLKHRLPEHMMPSSFVQVSDIPLNANGKVDKQALLQNASMAMHSDTSYQPPSTETEIQLAAIWEQVLLKKNIGIKDDFFTLGGHSIRVMEVLMKIQQVFHVEVPVNTIFSNPTIESLSREIKLIQWMHQDEANIADAGVEHIIF